jgi:hypothetical protein
VDENVPALDLVEELTVRGRDREARLGHAPPALLLEIGTVEVGDLGDVVGGRDGFSDFFESLFGGRRSPRAGSVKPAE